MAKLKVGDKVRIVFGDGFIEWVSDMRKFIGKTVTISEVSENSNHPWFRIAGHCFHWNECDAELIEQPRREFIVIRRDGAKTIAELRHDREVIKSGTATCAPSDTFDLNTGAKLAFDRLMGREAKPITGKSFDRIFVDDIAPAPEPPKFYTGKVFAVSAKNAWKNTPDITQRNGRIYEIKDGVIVGDKTGIRGITDPYKSFGEFCTVRYFTNWAEVKEPSDVH